ncbi:MAG TPA: GlsB/YeaQ/YmgE family stress response membrane protein [Firmicutes bacterium]|nr:GlsB/YeaQ/YmgE family stress response membrane protein [Bacillota bacterium]
MWIVHFLVYLLIAGVCGFIAAQMTGARRLNIIALILLGLVGAYVGGWIAGFLHLPPIFTVAIAGKTFPVLWAIAGAALVVTVYGMISQH